MCGCVRYSPTSCTPLHGTLEGRLISRESSHGLLLGRYLYQNFDFSLAHAPLWDPTKRSWLHGGRNAPFEVRAEVRAERSSRARSGGSASNGNATDATTSRLTNGLGGAPPPERLWSEEEATSSHALHAYRDLPAGPSVCQRSPVAYCGCPALDDAERRVTRGAMDVYCPPW